MARTKIEKAILAQVDEERESGGTDGLIVLSVLTGRLKYHGAITPKTAERIQNEIDKIMEADDE